MLESLRPQERDACFLVLYLDKNAELFLIPDDPYKAIPELPKGAELFQVQVPCEWEKRNALTVFASMIARDTCDYYHWEQVSKKLNLWQIQRAEIGKDGQWNKI